MIKLYEQTIKHPFLEAYFKTFVFFCKSIYVNSVTSCCCHGMASCVYTVVVWCHSGCAQWWIDCWGLPVWWIGPSGWIMYSVCVCVSLYLFVCLPECMCVSVSLCACVSVWVCVVVCVCVCLTFCLCMYFYILCSPCSVRVSGPLGWQRYWCVDPLRSSFAIVWSGSPSLHPSLLPSLPHSPSPLLYWSIAPVANAQTKETQRPTTPP